MSVPDQVKDAIINLLNANRDFQRVDGLRSDIQNEYDLFMERYKASLGEQMPFKNDFDLGIAQIPQFSQDDVNDFISRFKDREDNLQILMPFWIKICTMLFEGRMKPIRPGELELPVLADGAPLALAEAVGTPLEPEAVAADPPTYVIRRVNLGRFAEAVRVAIFEVEEAMEDLKGAQEDYAEMLDVWLVLKDEVNDINGVLSSLEDERHELEARRVGIGAQFQSALQALKGSLERLIEVNL